MSSFCITGGRIWDGSRFMEGNLFWDDGGRIQVLGDVASPGKAEPLTETGALGKAAPRADYVFDAAGALVCPGLVDVHTHFKGISTDLYGMQAEMACFPFGVTAAADCGAEFGSRKELDNMMVKNVVFAAVPIRNNTADLTAAEENVQKFGDKTIGLKVYFDHEVADTAPLKQVCQYARRLGLKVMVHCSDQSSVSMADTLNVLSKGDILTHMYHGGPCCGAVDDFSSLQKARERGIILDTGCAGYVHTDFAVLKKAVEQGVLPDTISSDITKLSAYVRGGRYGLTLCMSMFKTLGVPEEKILRAVTLDAAAALGQNWGHLSVGGPADITVLRYGNQPYSLTDREGNTMEDRKGYECVLTVSGGQIVYRSL